MPEHISPLNGYVLLARTKPSETTQGGIVIPDSIAQAKIEWGEVLSISRDDDPVEVGWVVAFYNDDAEDITVDGNPCALVLGEKLLAWKTQ